MDDRMKTPAHLWIVGILSLLWNCFGAYDYTMTRLRNMEYLSQVPGVSAEQMLAYVDSLPIWCQVGWGLGVWGALLGSILLLTRSKHAFTAFAISFVGMIMSLGYEVAGMGPPAPGGMNEGAMAIMPVGIMIIGVLLLWYSWAQKRNGVLR